jgi:hypothetical protein
MALFNTRLSKAPGAVRTALASMIKKIRTTIESTIVYNPAQVAYPRGTVMSYVEQIGASVDLQGQVAPTTHDPALPPEESCKQQYAVVLEAELPAVSGGGAPGDATGRHGGGPVYVRLVTGLTLHVGDALWSTPLVATAGLATNIATSPDAIYIGMVSDASGYNPAAADGVSGCMAVLKHEAPIPVPPVP